MKIALILNFITPYRIGFYEKLCANHKFEWLVIHGKKEKEDGRPSYRGILNFPNYEVKYYETKFGPISIRYHKGIISKLRDWKPDIIITLGIPSILSNWLAILWAKRHDAYTINWHSGWEAQANNQYILPFKRLITRKYLSLVDHILVYSTKGKKYLEKIQSGKLDNITVCYNGLEIDPLIENESEFRTKGLEIRNQMGVGGKKIFLFVGGMIEEKRVPLLLNAFHQLQDSSNSMLWIVGDGPEKEKNIQLSECLNLENVKFLGRIIEDVDIFFAAADFFVLPGLGGLALNQALFWELPCIVSEADGTEDDLVIDNKTGFRFIPNNEKSLTIALEKCLALTNEERICMGSIGRGLILDRSNVNEMVKTFNLTVQQLANKGTGKSQNSEKTSF